MPGLGRPVETDAPLTAWWESYAGHRGLDYGWLKADPGRTQRIYAALDGVVASVYNGSGDNQDWGGRIVIDHGYGIRTTYNHLAPGTAKVAPGQRVSAGQFLAMMGATGRVTGIHLHFELYINGVRVDPRPYREGAMLPGLPSAPTLQPYQREVRQLKVPVLNGRGQANTSSPVAQTLNSGDVGDFDAWTRGQTVTIDGVTSDVWYRGKYASNWFAAAGFTSQGVDGLTFVTSSSPLQPHQRKVIAPNLNGRSGPGTQYEWQQALQPGDIGDFDGWTRGEKVAIGAVESDIWLRGAHSGDWFSMAGFEGNTTAGLPEVTFTPPTTPPVTPPTTPPGSVLDPTTPWKNRTPNSPLATWIGSPNFDAYDRRPAGAAPRHITLHWMAGTLTGTDSAFQNPGKIQNGRGTGTSTTYGIGLTQIHQYVDEAAYHHGDGDRESNRWGIAIEHEGGAPLSDGTRSPVAPSTIALSAKLLADIATRYGWDGFVLFSENLDTFRAKSDSEQQAIIVNFITTNPTKRLVFPHKAWVSTACPGTLDLAAVVAAANAILAPTPEPEPEPELYVTVARDELIDVRAEAQRIVDWTSEILA